MKEVETGDIIRRRLERRNSRGRNWGTVSVKNTDYENREKYKKLVITRTKKEKV